MDSIQDIKAHAVKRFFNFWGHLGNRVVNARLSGVHDISRDLAYGSDAEQTMDVFSPAVSISPVPVLVYFHGGGWISADKRLYDGICARLSETGLLVFNANYRLAPRSRFPAQLQDAAQAIRWIHRNAAQFGGDSSRMILAGDSAGAQLASWYASALVKESLFERAGIREPIPATCLQGLMLFYGVYDFDTVLDTGFPFIKVYTSSLLGAEPEGFRRNAELASPIRHVSARLPPVLLCAGHKDKLFGQSVAYANALKSAGVSCKTLLFTEYNSAHHGFLFFRWLAPSKRVFAAADEFLQGLCTR